MVEFLMVVAPLGLVVLAAALHDIRSVARKRPEAPREESKNEGSGGEV